MEYPIGSPTCWNASNVNCTDHTHGHNTEQCSFGCSYNAGEEIAAMSAYDNGALIMRTTRLWMIMMLPFSLSETTKGLC